MCLPNVSYPGRIESHEWLTSGEVNDGQKTISQDRANSCKIHITPDAYRGQRRFEVTTPQADTGWHDPLKDIIKAPTIPLDPAAFWIGRNTDWMKEYRSISLTFSDPEGNPSLTTRSALTLCSGRN